MNLELTPFYRRTSKWACTTFIGVIIIALLISIPVDAHELKDISISASTSQINLSLTFAATSAESEFPDFFQKSDSTRGIITLSFLETETTFPLGKQSLDSANPGLEELQLRKMTSPSGKVFLAVEIKIKDASMLESVLQPGKNGSLKILIGKGAKKKSNWSLAKSLRAREEYLAAKAAPAPEAASHMASTSTTPTAPTKPTVSTAPTASASSENTSKPESPIDSTHQTKPDINTKTEVKPEVTPETKAETRSETKPEPKAKVAETKVVEPPDGMKSAHEEGAALEASQSKKQLSSSKIFSVGLGKKSMIMTKDSVALSDAPEGKGKALKKMGVGELVERLEIKNAWAKVVAGSDTGYIKVSNAVYADEITADQEKSIKDKIEAKAVKLAAVEAKIKLAAEKLAASIEKHQADSLKKVGVIEEKAQAKEQAKALAEQAKMTAQQKKSADSLAKIESKKQKADSIVLVAKMKKQRADSLAMAAKMEKLPPATPPTAAPLVQPLPANSISKTNAKAAKPDSVKSMARKDSVIKLAATKNKMSVNTPPPKLAIADSPELTAKLAKEKKAAEDEKMRVEPEENRVSYNSYGRRDPFIPVEQGAVDNGIDIDQMKVVGIIWQSSEPMAVLEHTHEANVSFTVKQGDPVHNGKVARITREGVTFDITEYGISRSYSLKLVSSKEGTKK